MIAYHYHKGGINILMRKEILYLKAKEKVERLSEEERERLRKTLSSSLLSQLSEFREDEGLTLSDRVLYSFYLYAILEGREDELEEETSFYEDFNRAKEQFPFVDEFECDIVRLVISEVGIGKEERKYIRKMESLYPVSGVYFTQVGGERYAVKVRKTELRSPLTIYFTSNKEKAEKIYHLLKNYVRCCKDGECKGSTT